MKLDQTKTETFVSKQWETSILPVLSEYISVPNLSPAFDKEWQENGHIEKALNLVIDWVKSQDIRDLKLSVERLEGRTPLLFIDIKGSEGLEDKTALLYGHLDKQPEMTGWDSDKGPWTPVLTNDKLYGRGSADDGYAVFSALTAIKALQMQGVSHPRCVLIIESSEEGGSGDLPFYIEEVQGKIGTPDLIVCLDAGCGNYDQLWLTTSLRGAVVGEVSVSLLKEGIHSGNGGGIIASSFRVLRALLERIEETNTGKILLKSVDVSIPTERIEQSKEAATAIKEELRNSFPLLEDVSLVSDDAETLILNRTWRASLSYTGIRGIPEIEVAGNVLRPETALKISLRLPPTTNAKDAAKELKELLESNPPYKANVTYKINNATNGWNSPSLKKWLSTALDEASSLYFKQKPQFMGEGGSIPFMNLLAEKYPEAQFMVTGVLGPHSNAHGPNEFLHIPTVKKLTCCVAHVLAAFSPDSTQ